MKKTGTKSRFHNDDSVTVSRNSSTKFDDEKYRDDKREISLDLASYDRTRGMHNAGQEQLMGIKKKRSKSSTIK